MSSRFLYLLTSTSTLLFSLCVRALPNSNNAAPKCFSSWTENLSEGRLLIAARVTSQLKARGVSEMLSYKQKLHYIDADSYRSISNFVAQVSISSRLPSLMLEDMENHFDEIVCDDSTVHLYFNAIETLKSAYTELSKVGQFILITSHENCNKNGERDTHMVSTLNIFEEERLLVLSAFRIPWKDAVHSMKVEFGGSNKDYELRQRDKMSRRQTPTLTPSSSLIVTSPTTSIAFPNPTSSGTQPQMPSVTEHLNSHWLNTAILPPDNVLGQLMAIGPPIPAGFTISCKNCSIHGTIEVFSGSFSMSSNNGTSNQTERIIDFFVMDNGYVELRANDFSAHIELENKINPSKQLIRYTAPLPPISFSPFQIPGIAAVGPQLNPQVSIGFEVSTELDFTYGFDVVVPNDSNIIIDIGNFTNSTIQGFPNTKITALPFQAAVDNVALTVEAGFQPQLLLGISVLGHDATAGFGVSLDLPVVSATLEQVTHVTSKCEDITNSTSGNGVAKDILGSLTHIRGEVGFGVGLLEQANLDIGGHNVNKNASFTIFSTGYPLPTTCISFDSKAKTYGPASATSAGAASGGQKSGGEPSVINPLVKVLGMRNRVEVAAGFLILVSFCFLPL